MMYAMLKERTDALKGEMEAFLAKLVAERSPSLMEGGVAKLVKAEMESLGYDKVAVDEAGNVVGMIFGRESSPCLALVSHMDTVEAGAGWTRDPYKPEKANGMLYGLGSSDCKSGIAAQVYAAALLKRCLLPLKGCIVVAATAAEENGCGIGSRTLMEKTLPSLGVKPDFVIMGETTDGNFYYGHDGRVEIEIKVEGANPFNVSDSAKSIIKTLSADPAEPKFENNGALRKATLRMERRISGGENAQSVVSSMKKVAEMAMGGASSTVSVDVAVVEEQQSLYTGKQTLARKVVGAWTTDPFHPMIERSRQAIEAAGLKFKPGRWELGKLGMGTSGSVFANEFKTPVVGYGPGSETSAHAIDEAVDLAKLADVAYGTSCIAHSIVGVPVFGWTSEDI